MSYLSPPAKFAATYVDLVDGTVKPAVGYKLYTYSAGTSTPKDSYINAALTANTNPVILDARGECDLVLSGNYKLILKTDADATVWTVDNITDLTSNGTFAAPTLTGALTVTSTAVTWSGNPTHSGNHTWNGNQVFNGNVTLGDSSADTITVTGTMTAPLFSGTPTGTIATGTYAPGFAFTTNITAATAPSAFNYIRIGTTVFVTGVVNITPTAAGAAEVRIGLPFAATFAGGELSGCGNSILHGGGYLIASAANTASFFFNAASGVIQGFGVSFSYRGA